ncbi:MAG: Acetyltransferase, GNAT family, partial [uncultured Thermomicrobiales bacterium]
GGPGDPATNPSWQRAEPARDPDPDPGRYQGASLRLAQPVFRDRDAGGPGAVPRPLRLGAPDAGVRPRRAVAEPRRNRRRARALGGPAPANDDRRGGRAEPDRGRDVSPGHGVGRAAETEFLRACGLRAAGGRADVRADDRARPEPVPRSGTRSSVVDLRPGPSRGRGRDRGHGANRPRCLPLALVEQRRRVPGLRRHPRRRVV